MWVYDQTLQETKPRVTRKSKPRRKLQPLTAPHQQQTKPRQFKYSKRKSFRSSKLRPRKSITHGPIRSAWNQRLPQLPPRDRVYLAPHSQSPPGSFMAQIHRGKKLRKTKSPRKRSPKMARPQHAGILRGMTLKKTSGPRARSPKKIRLYGKGAVPDVPSNLLSAIGGGNISLRKTAPRKKRVTSRQKSLMSLGNTMDKFRRDPLYPRGQQQASGWSWSPENQRTMPQFVGAVKRHQQKSKSPKKTTLPKKPPLPIRPNLRQAMIADRQDLMKRIPGRRRAFEQNEGSDSWS